METPERSDGLLSPWSAAGAGLPATPGGWDEPAGEPRPAALDVGIIWRAFRRHWWQILLIWIITSAAALTAIYKFVLPTYRATAWLQIEPSPRSPILPAGGQNREEFAPFMETQVLLITSPGVLSRALQDRTAKELPRVIRSPDPEAELREDLEVEAQKGTHIILLSMATETPTEAPVLVNAVVHAYQKEATTWTTNEGLVQMAKLKDTAEKFERDFDTKKVALSKLLKDRGGDTSMVKSKDQMALDQYRHFSDRLVSIRTERIRAEAAKAILEEEAREQARTRRGPTAGSAPLSPKQLDEQIKQAFYRLPDVTKLIHDYQTVEAQLERARRLARRGNEPTVGRFAKQLAALKGDFERLWDQYQPELKRQVTSGAMPGHEDDPVEQQKAADLRLARLDVARLQAEEKILAEQVDNAKDETKQAGDEAVNIEFAAADVEFARKLYEGVVQALRQAEYEARSGARISLISLAKLSNKPEKNTRLKLMIVSPILILGALWGLFLLLEIRSGRVANPDDLPARVRVGVLGVVPPLPAARAGRGGRALRDDRRRVEEFVQSLDHLRVALCAPAHGVAGRRCLLITSAVGGEGKTTLAAQLAGRCANAGLLTLLIDADLRRPSLGDLLEVPEGPGLADILSGEATPESAMVVIGNAGGFHLLPAGTLVADPGRLLHGERLGTLLAQFRATFDVVIVDAPPVLAVPDALLLGRWTDGAVLAVRHDTSRFPLVERANRRLASVGIAVLGAVVNGVRTMETNYGAYHYDPYAGRGATAATGGAAGDPG